MTKVVANFAANDWTVSVLICFRFLIVVVVIVLIVVVVGAFGVFAITFVNEERVL
jgi:nitrate reductase NapE component